MPEMSAELVWQGMSPARKSRPTSGRGLSALARALDGAAVVTVPPGLDADIYVLLTIAKSISTSSSLEMARLLRSHPSSVGQALENLEKAIGTRRLIVERLERLEASGAELLDLLEPRRREVALWLERHATVTLSDHAVEALPLGPPAAGWDTEHLWRLVDQDAERFGLAVALRIWVGVDHVEGRLDAPSLVRDLWSALPADARELLAALIVHERPAPRAVLARSGIADDELMKRAVDGWLVDEIGGELRLAAPWYAHAPIPAVERASLHRRLAAAFEAIAGDADPLATLEAHRHYVAIPDLPKARELARFGAAYLLDHARQQSERKQYSAAASEYEAVLRLDDQARDAGGAIGDHARAYARHYCHFNRARADSEPMIDTLAGYEGALVLWPENALFWSRLVRVKFLLGRWDEAARSLRDAYEKVPAHPNRNAVLIVRTAERLLERNQILPALIVATERAIDALSLGALWRQLEHGVSVSRIWVPGGRDLRLSESRTFRLFQRQKKFEATWLGVSAVSTSPRAALRQLVPLVERQMVDDVERPDGTPEIASLLDLDSTTDDDARWIAGLRRLRERCDPIQADVVLSLWRAFSSGAPGLRRPAIGPGDDGGYHLSWSYDDLPAVVTIEVRRDGQCEWFARAAPSEEPTQGEGSVEDARSALAATMTAFAP